MILLHFRRTGMAQWWERSATTSGPDSIPTWRHKWVEFVAPRWRMEVYQNVLIEYHQFGNWYIFGILLIFGDKRMIISITHWTCQISKYHYHMRLRKIRDVFVTSGYLLFKKKKINNRKNTPSAYREHCDSYWQSDKLTYQSITMNFLEYHWKVYFRIASCNIMYHAHSPISVKWFYHVTK